MIFKHPTGGAEGVSCSPKIGHTILPGGGPTGTAPYIYIYICMSGRWDPPPMVSRPANSLIFYWFYYTFNRTICFSNGNSLLFNNVNFGLGWSPRPPPLVGLWALKIIAFPIVFQYFLTYQLHSLDAASPPPPCGAVGLKNHCFSYSISILFNVSTSQPRPSERASPQNH